MGTPRQDALAYWHALNAPPAHVARRLGIDAGEVTAAWARPDARPPTLAGYPSATPWPERTVTALVRRGLQRPDDETLLFAAGEGALSTADVRMLVSQIAAALVASGAGPEGPVAVDATQRLESYLVVLAALLIGAPVVRLSAFVNAEGFRHMLRAAPARITVSAHVDALEGMAEAGIRIALDDAPGLPFAEWLEDFPADEALPAVMVSPADTALIGFTSGSTGLPKRVATSHEAVFRSSEAMQAVFAFTRADVFATSTDFSALSAFRSLFTMPLISGARVMVPGAVARTTPLQLAAECRDFGVTRLTAVPAVFRGLIAARARLGPNPFPTLMMALSGSGILDQSVRDRFETAFGVPVIDYYGGREFATAVYADPNGRETISSVGGVPVNCLIRIVNGEGGVVADGGIGEILVHSDCLMQTLPPPEHPDWQGWYATGDMGRFDHLGRLQVVGRRREVIKARDGTLLFPIALEADVRAIDGVVDAAVFGHVAADGIEHLVVTAILAAPDAGFAERARAHMLATGGQHRVPSRVFQVDELPRVASGKIDRPGLRAQFLAQLQDL